MSFFSVPSFPVTITVALSIEASETGASVDKPLRIEMERLAARSSSPRRAADVDASPTSEGSPSSQTSTLTALSTPPPGRDGRQRRIRIERRLQWAALVVALLSVLHLLTFAGFYRWPSFATERENAVFSGNLTSLSARELKRGPLLSEDWDEESEEMHREPEKKIPRIIHQTYKTDQIPKEMVPFVRSWRVKNPSWQYVFYNDTQCVAFVEKEFPEYLAAYNALSKNVERSDFFRYMVILRYGGVYADLDTECLTSMDDVIEGEDEMLVGWECDVPNDDAAVRRHFVRRRLVLQWIFAAAPGHPALKEICDFIANNAVQQISHVSSNYDTLEKTGPGAWTDTILRYVSSPAKQHGIRVLPQVAFGSHPSETDGILRDSPGILVKHHFLGSWKSSYWGYKKELQMLQSFFGLEQPSLSQVIKPLSISYFPVSADFTPTFTIVVRSAEAGAFVADSDVSLALTRWGMWQAGDLVPRRPRLVDVLAGSLGDVDMQLGLLDIGAGLGFFSLAAASRQHPVMALEVSDSNIVPFNMSVHTNGFTERLKLYTSVDSFKNALQFICMKTEGRTLDVTSFAEMALEDTHSTPAVNCAMHVGALRLGYTGWSVWNDIHGSDYIRRHSPEIVAIEYAPWKMKQHGWENPVNFLREVVEMGYGEVYHAGQLCQRRWTALVAQVDDFKKHEAPSWCNVAISDFEIFDRIEVHESQAPENILFVNRTAKGVEP